MKIIKKNILIFASIIILAAFSKNELLLDMLNSNSSDSNFVQAKVTKHVDGDTVYVTFNDGTVEKVRLIGVNTPETRSPTKGVEYFGKEASSYTKSSLLGKNIYLEKDVSEKDKYDRLLRYIWLEKPEKINLDEINTKMFNGILLSNGYAQVSTFPPDVKYQDYFLKIERDAKLNDKGLWEKNKK